MKTFDVTHPTFTRPFHDPRQLSAEQRLILQQIADAPGAVPESALLTSTPNRRALQGLRTRKLIRTVSLVPEPTYAINEAGRVALQHDIQTPLKKNQR